MLFYRVPVIFQIFLLIIPSQQLPFNMTAWVNNFLRDIEKEDLQNVGPSIVHDLNELFESADPAVVIDVTELPQSADPRNIVRAPCLDGYAQDLTGKCREALKPK